MFRKFLKEAHSNKWIGKLKKCIFFFACSRLFNKRHRRTRAHIVTFRRDPGAEQEEKQKEKHKLYAQTTRCTHARTKRIDFPVGVRKQINPPQPPTYMQTSTCERASLCQTYIKHTHTHTHTHAHANTHILTQERERRAVPSTRGALPGKAYIGSKSFSSQTTNRHDPTPTISRQTPPPTSKP